MNSEFDLTRDVAEKVLKRAMTPVRGALAKGNADKCSDEEYMEISLGNIRELDRDLGVLGITLATRYSEQVEYQTALGVMSAENVRLQNTVEQLTALAGRYKAEMDSLAGALAKTRNVNDKLKELTPVSGFHA